MTRIAKPPEGLCRPYAPERFEYRIWGAAFPGLPDPAEAVESAEVYLLPEQDGLNVKLRRGALEIKRLVGERAGLQRWLPALRCVLPLPARVVAQELCPALGVTAPPLARRHYDLAALLAEVAPALAGVRALQLCKQRRQFDVCGARAERTRVCIGEVTAESVAVEAERFSEAAQATEELALRRLPNLDYVMALRRILEGWRPEA